MGVYDRLSAVLTENAPSVPNTSCGCQEDWFTSVDDFAQNANMQFSKNGVNVTVKEIYFFDTLKEMHRWLSE